jgi:hypothetical protein
LRQSARAALNRLRGGSNSSTMTDDRFPTSHETEGRTRPEPTWHPYRVTRDLTSCGPRLTAPQELILAALVHRCPRPGDEISARVLARDTGLRLGSLVLSLRTMAGKRLVVEHPAETDDAEPAFSPSLIGRARLNGARRPLATARRPR